MMKIIKSSEREKPKSFCFISSVFAIHATGTFTPPPEEKTTDDSPVKE